MNALARLAAATGAAAAVSAAAASAAVAAPVQDAASLINALPSESAISRIAGTQMASGVPTFSTTPIFAVQGSPAAPGVTRTMESYARAFNAGGVEAVSVFVAQHANAAGARARVLARLRSDEGTGVTDPGIGAQARSYTIDGGDVFTRAAVGTASIGARVSGPKASAQELRRVSEALTRLIARQTPAALVAGPPSVPAYLQRVVPPMPPGWKADGVLAAGVSTAAVDADPGYGALRTRGWGTFQYVMGLARSNGTTQVAIREAHTSPASASGLSISTTGLPFGSPNAATAYVSLLPKALPRTVAVPITVAGAAVAQAVRAPQGRYVLARVTSPRGDAIEAWCHTQSYRRLGAAGITRCTDAISAQAQAWLQAAPE